MLKSLQDYLYELATSVRRLSPDSFDAHLFALEVNRVLFSRYGGHAKYCIAL